MIVIADTTPVRYLVLLGLTDLLPRIYGEVIIPTAVFEELSSSGSPNEVREFLSAKPDWLVVKSLSKPVSPRLLEILDRGESEAIELAIEISAGLILIDERLGRRVAHEMGLEYTGTLGILRTAAARGWINISDAIEKLDQANFYLSPKLRRRILGEIE